MNAISKTVSAASRLLFHDYGGHAFTAQLARQMARLGHHSTYLSFADFDTPKGRVDRADDDPPGFVARQLSLGKPFDKDNLLRRGLQQAAYARLAAERLLAERPATVISSNAPLEVQARLLSASRRVGARFVFWLQDVHSEAIARLLGRRNALLGRLAATHYGRLERRLLQQSDHVVTIADDFGALIGPEGWGVSGDRIDVVENWAPLDDIGLHRRDNDWAEANFRRGRRRLVYAGTLARKHDPEILVDLALRLDADIHLFSGGSGADHVRQRAAELGLGNLFVRPWTSVEDFPKMLAGADILLACIDQDAAAFSVPSKVLAYLAAGRPILASIPSGNLASRTLLDAGAGLLSEPGDREALLRHAAALLADPQLRDRLGQNGRVYAEASFDIEHIARRFDAILAGLERRQR